MPLGLIAFAAACAFVGVGLYINIAEQPARLGLAPSAMMREWTPSNRRGFILLSALALLSTILAFAYFARTGDIRWTIGGTIMLASGLYAYYVIEPVNFVRYTFEKDAPESVARELMREWGLVEWGLVAIGLWACGIFAWALIQAA
ncbi:MAG: DUF1772 domain-containing protein [Xanthobacteraceae bacterium]|nr:DUF1772 domain-containing protein [Xanthobacteraceae bacterium]